MSQPAPAGAPAARDVAPAGSVNETWLHGRGRALRWTGVVFTLAALGLADLPPFATFLGKGLTEASGAARGVGWITAVLVASSILVGGAVLSGSPITQPVAPFRPEDTGVTVADVLSGAGSAVGVLILAFSIR